MLRHAANVERTPNGWVKMTTLVHHLGITRDELCTGRGWHPQLRGLRAADLA